MKSPIVKMLRQGSFSTEESLSELVHIKMASNIKDLSRTLN